MSLASQNLRAQTEPQPWFSNGEPIASPVAEPKATTSQSPWWRTAFGAVAVQFDIRDVLVTVSLASIGYGCHLLSPAAGWIIPGVILLWIALPQRPRFLEPKPPTIVTIDPTKGGGSRGRA